MDLLLNGYVTIATIAQLVLSLALLGAAIFAAIHAARTPEDAFRAAGKWQKNYWIIALVVCALLTFLPGYFGMVIAAVGVLVYLLDARPKLDEVRRPRY
ncbi:DUF2516 family protein [Tsukamurella sp. 1534]|uniref:DUF2516 family protein n=1 Tax=Tsukamurella sp. 1534 TaxID=1151061 RepID=UPI0002FDBB32|nr:DUF2516 family protein [Tsukamurella sp. 1534]